MPQAVIGVGTNLGDRLASLRRAVRRLRAAAPALRIGAVSPIYESDAMVPDGAPPDWARPYLNLVLLAAWTGPPEALLARLKSLEVDLGRKPAERWAPREIDLDLLAFGRVARSAEGLTVPQAGLAERPFAVLPMADVAPWWTFPASSPLAGETAATLASRWGGSPEQVPFRTRRTGYSLTELVGIVNVTPDSFSDGGRWTDPDLAIRQARRLVAEGATVIDVGAESTRPGATPVAPDEEWRRLGPVLAALSAEPGVIVSVDTRHAPTAARALEAGARWINDVTGLADPVLADLVGRAGADAVVMHSVTVPPERGRVLPTDHNPVDWLLGWGRRTLARLAAAGLPPERVVLDPGLGFGKTADQSLAILRHADRLHELGVRVLVGPSRKSFLTTLMAPDHPAAADPAARDFESAWLAGHLASRGIDLVRVHDVALAARARRAAALLAPAVTPGQPLDRPAPDA